MNRPRVLFLTHRTPHPPNRGDRIRSYHLLKFLAARSRVSLAALADEPVPDESRRTLEQLCEQVAVVPLGRWSRWLRGGAALAAGGAATEGLFRSPRLARVLRGKLLSLRDEDFATALNEMSRFLSTF